MQRGFIDRLLVVTWMMVIFWFSHQPASVSSEMSSGLLHQLIELFSVFLSDVQIDNDIIHTFIRKMAHFLIYFVLGILVYRALQFNENEMKNTFVASLIICFMYALSDEIHQLFINGRSGELSDVLIDSLGSATGCYMYRRQTKLTKIKITK